jgi:hypothetical protein
MEMDIMLVLYSGIFISKSKKLVGARKCNNFPPTPYSFLWEKVLYFQFIENFLERT